MYRRAALRTIFCPYAAAVILDKLTGQRQTYAGTAALAAAAGTLAAVRMNSRLGGTNGDVLGACEVAAELLTLGVFSL